jgi:hypothetical protein
MPLVRTETFWRPAVGAPPGGETVYISVGGADTLGTEAGDDVVAATAELQAVMLAGEPVTMAGVPVGLG